MSALSGGCCLSYHFSATVGLSNRISNLFYYRQYFLLSQSTRLQIDKKKESWAIMCLNFYRWLSYPTQISVNCSHFHACLLNKNWLCNCLNKKFNTKTFLKLFSGTFTNLWSGWYHLPVYNMIMINLFYERSDNVSMKEDSQLCYKY